jgi:hypothetical protein
MFLEVANCVLPLQHQFNKRRMKKKIGLLLLTLMVFASCFLAHKFVGLPMTQYGTSFIYYGITTSVKNRIYVVENCTHTFKFSTGEIKEKSLLSVCYMTICNILTAVAIYCIYASLNKIIFYTLNIDVVGVLVQEF